MEAVRPQRRLAHHGGEAAAGTRERILRAAINTLRDDGFAATSARAIARRGGFNQALIFYHYGSVLDLLLGAVETVAAERLTEYRAALEGVNDLAAAIEIAREQYATDLREGHITVLVEMVAGASSVPQLGPEIVRCMQPWVEFAEVNLRRFLAGTPLQPLIPARPAAHALIAIYLGMELLDHLDPAADTSQPLFLVAEGLVHAIEPMLGRRRKRSTRRPQRVSLDGE
jgi:AcrR family transcriptional regulator